MKTIEQLKKVKLPIHMEFLVWTPEAARYALANHNPINRSCPATVVERLASDILDNNFAVSHQGVAFDNRGNLMDGQTRLSAVSKADRPTLILTVWDLPALGMRWDTVKNELVKTHLKIRTQDIVDVTRTRSFADMLCLKQMLADGTIDKQKNNSISATVKLVLRTILKQSSATHSQLMQVLDLFKDDMLAIEEIHAKYPTKDSCLRTTPVTTSLVIAHHFKTKEAKAFAQSLYTGEMLRTGDPAHTLRNKLINLPKVTGGTISRPLLIQRATLYALHKHCLQEKMTGFSRLADNSDLIYFLENDPTVADALAEIMHDGPKE